MNLIRFPILGWQRDDLITAGNEARIANHDHGRDSTEYRLAHERVEKVIEQIEKAHGAEVQE